MKYIKYLIFVLAGFILNSCEEFLNPLPESAVAIESFFQTDEDVLAGIVGIYDAIQGVNENTETNIGRANRGVQFEHLLTESNKALWKKEYEQYQWLPLHNLSIICINWAHF